MQLPDLLAEAGCTGTVHARVIGPRRSAPGGDPSLGPDAERSLEPDSGPRAGPDAGAKGERDDAGFGYRADDPVVPASVMKVQIALAVEIMIADGTLDPTARLRLGEVDRTPGPVGLSLFHDDAELSVRDLVTLMLTISDNVATDALLHRVGLDAVNAFTSRLGLTGTVIRSDLRTMIDSIGTAAGFGDYAALTAWFESGPDPADAARVRTLLRQAPALDARVGNRTTARDMTSLLALIWTDRAGPVGACARVRQAMARQMTRNRLAAAAPPGVRVAAKSGGLLGVVRNEIGVLTYPDGTAYAVAVFTRAEHPGAEERTVNAAIGRAAQEAILQVRGQQPR